MLFCRQEKTRSCEKCFDSESWRDHLKGRKTAELQQYMKVSNNCLKSKVGNNTRRKNWYKHSAVLPEASVQWPKVSKTEGLSSGSRFGLASREKRWETTPYWAKPEARVATKNRLWMDRQFSCCELLMCVCVSESNTHSYRWCKLTESCILWQKAGKTTSLSLSQKLDEPMQEWEFPNPHRQKNFPEHRLQKQIRGDD